MWVCLFAALYSSSPQLNHNNICHGILALIWKRLIFWTDIFIIYLSYSFIPVVWGHVVQENSSCGVYVLVWLFYWTASGLCQNKNYFNILFIEMGTTQGCLWVSSLVLAHTMTCYWYSRLCVFLVALADMVWPGQIEISWLDYFLQLLHSYLNIHCRWTHKTIWVCLSTHTGTFGGFGLALAAWFDM